MDIKRSLVCLALAVSVSSLWPGDAYAVPIVKYDFLAVDRSTDELIRLTPHVSGSAGRVTIGSLGFDEVNALAYDKTRSVLFGVDNATGQLLTVDSATGAATPVGSIGLGGDSSSPGYLGDVVTDMTFGPGNQLFGMTNGVGSTGRLITIDPDSGSGAVVSSSAFQQLQGLAYEPDQDRLFASKFFGSSGHIFDVDPADGTVNTAASCCGRWLSLTDDPASAGNLIGIFAESTSGGAEKTLARLDTTTFEIDLGGTIPGSTGTTVWGFEAVPRIVDEQLFAIYAIDTVTDELVTLTADPFEFFAHRDVVGPIGFDQATGLAYHQPTDTFFSVDETTDQLIQIERLTGVGSAIGPIGFGGGVFRDITLGPAGKIFGTHDEASNRVVIIDGNTGAGTPLDGILGTEPGGIAYDADNNIMYAAQRLEGGHLEVINPVTGNPSGEVLLGTVGIHHLADDPNSARLFAIQSFGGVKDRTDLLRLDPVALTTEFLGRISPEGGLPGVISGLETVIVPVEPPPTPIPDFVNDPNTQPASADDDINEFSGLHVLSGNSIDLDLPSVIITHGWRPFVEFGVDNPMEILEAAVIERLSGRANVLEYNWKNAFYFDPFWPGVFAPGEGARLGEEFIDTFGFDYDQPVHFIGHSYGSVVNATALRFIHEVAVNLGENIGSDVQMTVLEAPSRIKIGIELADLLPIPDFEFGGSFDTPFNSLFFNAIVPSETVDYLDNFFGTIPVLSFGKPISGAAPFPGGHPFLTDHSGIHQSCFVSLLCDDEAYTDIIRDADWVSAVRDTFVDRPAPEAWNPFAVAKAVGRLVAELAQDLGDAAWSLLTGAAEEVMASVGALGRFIEGILLSETSPTVLSQTTTVPSNADLASFDVFFDSIGDGDWVTIHFDDQLLWSMAIEESLASVDLTNIVFPLGNIVGRQGTLYFTLNSVGERNARVILGDIEFVNVRGRAAVAEPVVAWTTAGLFVAVLVVAHRGGRERPLARASWRKA